MPEKSPVICWLLAAATVAVNAVAVFSLLSSNYPDGLLYGAVLFQSLCVSQLGLVCIWSALARRKSLWTYIAPIVATLLATFVSAAFFSDPEDVHSTLTSYLAFYGVQAALTIIALWLLQRTRFWQRLDGTVADWRYSVAQILIAMTVVAVLAAAMKNSNFLYDGYIIYVAATCSYAALAVASAVIWQSRWHWLLRLGGALALAIFLSAGITLLEGPFDADFATFIGAHYISQALVLSAWLAWGPILPTASGAEQTS